MTDKKTLTGPGGMRVVLDAKEIHPDDPGAGTPAMVYLPFGRGSATYWCALNEGAVDTPNGDCELLPRQIRWLEEIENEITEWLNGHQ